MVEWLSANWQVVTIAILVIDKLVALSPTQMDDLIWTSVKGLLKKLTGK